MLHNTQNNGRRRRIGFGGLGFKVWSVEEMKAESGRLRREMGVIQCDQAYPLNNVDPETNILERMEELTKF